MNINLSIEIEIEVPADTSTRQKRFNVTTGGRALVCEYEEQLPAEWKAVIGHALKEHAHAVSFVGAKLAPPKL